MTHTFSSSYTAFNGYQRIASGSLKTVALVVKQTIENENGQVLIFDDNTGRSIDINTKGSDQEVLARLPQGSHDSTEAGIIVNEQRRRGRPKLGVISREVTMLPRHWEWLNAQPGGASVALRKLVEEARRKYGEKNKHREAIERAYHFMSAMAGDMPGFEETARALFANDHSRLHQLTAAWPKDVRDYALSLAFSNDHDATQTTYR